MPVGENKWMRTDLVAQPKTLVARCKRLLGRLRAIPAWKSVGKPIKPWGKSKTFTARRKTRHRRLRNLFNKAQKLQMTSFVAQSRSARIRPQSLLSQSVG